MEGLAQSTECRSAAGETMVQRQSTS